MNYTILSILLLIIFCIFVLGIFIFYYMFNKKNTNLIQSKQYSVKNIINTQDLDNLQILENKPLVTNNLKEYNINESQIQPHIIVFNKPKLDDLNKIYNTSNELQNKLAVYGDTLLETKNKANLNIPSILINDNTGKKTKY